MYVYCTHEKSLRYIEKGVTGREKVTRKQLSIQKVVGKNTIFLEDLARQNLTEGSQVEKTFRFQLVKLL